MKRVLTIFGTRPEAIKLSPLVKLLAEQPNLQSKVCVTAQHREMLDQVLEVFEIAPDFDLDLMQTNQNLTALMAEALRGIDHVLESYQPDMVVVQGDTATTLAAAQAAYFRQIPVFHVEAGLRTGNLNAPWPEEGNRKMVSAIATMHFVATEAAANNLLSEGVSTSKILQTGNTVIDALYTTLKNIEAKPRTAQALKARFDFLNIQNRLALITAHRRESFGDGLRNIIEAIAQLANDFPNVDFVFPVHPNPQVVAPVHERLSTLVNVHLIDPLSYIEFVYLMSQSTLILTDSGGLQEEAPALGKPVLLLRVHTERPEAIAAGAVRMVGLDKTRIVHAVRQLLTDPIEYKTMAQVRQVYGDGHASQRIVQKISEFLETNEPKTLVDA